jgi:hypothetical protein
MGWAQTAKTAARRQDDSPTSTLRAAHGRRPIWRQGLSSGCEVRGRPPVWRRDRDATHARRVRVRTVNVRAVAGSRLRARRELRWGAEAVEVHVVDARDRQILRDEVVARPLDVKVALGRAGLVAGVRIERPPPRPGPLHNLKVGLDIEQGTVRRKRCLVRLLVHAPSRRSARRERR